LREKVGVEMGKKIDKKIAVEILFLIIFITSWAEKAEALEPRLLWEKTIPFEIGIIKTAAQSGDVIISSRKARQIILYDKQGNKRFHWGPRIDRQPMGIDLSDDGSIIRFSTSRTEEFSLKSKTPGWDSRIHYVTWKGKELWNREYLGAAYLSPDGKMVAIGTSAGEGENLTTLDSQGRVLWKYISRVAHNIVFLQIATISFSLVKKDCIYWINPGIFCGKKMMRFKLFPYLKVLAILLRRTKKSTTGREIFLWKAKLLYPVMVKGC
jgi:hypothetical protein